MIFKCSASLLVVVTALALSAAAQTNSPAQSATATPAANDALNAKVESYLRVLFGWTPEYKVTLGPATPSPISGLVQVPVSVAYQGHTDTGTVYVTKDGRFMFRGEIRDLSKDPFAETRAKIKLGDSPSIGPAGAKLT
ncbi:MAG: hypothetical protein WA876_11635, partial [Candidatus Acidiferrales bacterium]